MRDRLFECDDDKAAQNSKKHRVTFVLAREVFDDANALEAPDEDPDEPRWRRTGLTRSGVLPVVYTERGMKNRIISARKATRYEQDCYFRQPSP